MTVVLLIIAFQIWKSLKPDFPQEEIFAFIWRLFLGGAIGALAVRGEMWGTVLGGIIITWWWAKKMNWDVWELGDFLAPNMLLFGLAAGLTGGSKNWPIIGVYGLGYLIIHYIRTAYRQFAWYKSGRVGLVLLTGLIWVGISEITIGFLGSDTIYYWQGMTAGQIAASWLISFGIIGIYIRSKTK